MQLTDKLVKALPGASSRDERSKPAYRLRDDEYVPDGLRRIAREQLTAAHDELDGASKRSLDDAVHETRKHLKRLRTSLRLARGALADETYQRENTAFRKTGRRLSASRDAQVRLQTLDALTSRFEDELAPRITAGLRARLVDEHERATARLHEDDTDVQAALAELDDARARTPAWRLQDDGFDAVSPGLKRIYRRGRKRMRAARDEPTAATFHEWRKRVKDLRYATQIVRVAQPKRLKRIGRAANELGDLLGDDHDLAVLRDYAEAHPQCFGDDESREALLAVIDRRSAQLREQALDCGARLYKRSPKRFTRAIERGWKKRAAADPRPVAG